jgi:hypothetical protein
MRPNKEKVYTYLFACLQQFGGYTGREIDKLARTQGFNRRTMKRNVEKWSKTDPCFAELKYIGQRSIPVTLEEIALQNQRLKESITCTKQDLIREINDKRKKGTNSFSDDEIISPHLTAELLLDLCRGERKWAVLTEEERKKLTKNRLYSMHGGSQAMFKGGFHKETDQLPSKGKDDTYTLF